MYFAGAFPSVKISFNFSYQGIGGNNMKCPVCKDVTLLMSEKNGIEIDYCPQCRGIWLDRGELDKIVERAKAEEKEYGQYGDYDRRRDDYRQNYREKDNYRYQKPKKKRSMLGDILEMFGEE